MRSILLMLVHPAFHQSRVNQALWQSALSLPELTAVDLCELYPDFYIDVALEQKTLRQHDLLVMLCPMYWYSIPSLAKHWLDLVLTPEFTHSEDGSELRNKYWLTAMSAGASAKSYQPEGANLRPVADYLLPLRQTARVCGMNWLPPWVIHHAHQLNDEQIFDEAQQFRAWLSYLQRAPDDELVALTQTTMRWED